MMTITLTNGITHTYPEANLSIDQVTERLQQEFWTLNTDSRFEIYRTSEIAHVEISKER